MALIHYRNEYSRLKTIVLYRPRLDEIDQTDAAAAMYIELPDARKVLQEFDGIVQKLRGLGVEVIILEAAPEMPTTTNMIFLRDVAFIFRDKIVLANMKHELRQAEPQKFKELMILVDSRYEKQFQNLNKNETMEGADILAISNNLVYVYAGSRTSNSIARMLEKEFGGLEAKIIEANIHGVPQHILGGVHILDKNLATRRIRYCTDSIENYEFLDFVESAETGEGFALNILTLSPREVLMPANNPVTKSMLEAKGIVCHEVEVSEIHKMGGGLACMILPLVREG